MICDARSKETRYSTVTVGFDRILQLNTPILLFICKMYDCLVVSRISMIAFSIEKFLFFIYLFPVILFSSLPNNTTEESLGLSKPS